MAVFVFDESGIRRVAKAVRKVEATDAPPAARQTNPILHGANVQVILVRSLEVEDGYYPGYMLDRDGESWSNEGECWVIELNQEPLNVQRYVGRLVDVDEDGTPTFAVESSGGVTAGVVEVLSEESTSPPPTSPATHGGQLKVSSDSGAWTAGDRVDVIEINDEELEAGRNYLGVKVASRDYGGETGFVDLFAVQAGVIETTGLDVADDLVTNAAFAQASCQFSQTKKRYKFEKGLLKTVT